MAEQKLIEAVRVHKVLYDIRDANYMKTKFKSRIWKQISEDLNLQDGDEAKGIWLKLRGCYRDARRRQAKWIKSGAAPETIKPWKFQKQMSFLEPFMSTGSRDGNINVSDDDSELPPVTLNEENLDRQEIEEESFCEMRDLSEVVEDKTDRRAEFTLTRSNQSTKRKHVQEDVQSLFKRSLEQREERAKQRTEERKQLESRDNLKDDPLYNFFIAMYQSTRKMPPKYQHKVRSQLFQAVSQAEEEILDIPSRSLSTYSSSPNYQAPSPQTWTDSQTSHQLDQQGNEEDCKLNITGLVDYVNRFDA